MEGRLPRKYDDYDNNRVLHGHQIQSWVSTHSTTTYGAGWENSKRGVSSAPVLTLREVPSSSDAVGVDSCDSVYTCDSFNIDERSCR